MNLSPAFNSFTSWSNSGGMAVICYVMFSWLEISGFKKGNGGAEETGFLFSQLPWPIKPATFEYYLFLSD